MKKQWEKNDDFRYSFWVDEKKVGEMDIDLNTIGSKANCTIGEKVFEIKRTGFWRSNIEITDSTEAIVLKAYPEKWYANSSIVEYGNNKYKLSIGNNPLAEFAIAENDKDILAYGLATENSELKVSILTSGDQDLILDFLLWYLFIPIAYENLGDSFLFLVS